MGLLLCWGSSPIGKQELRETEPAPKEEKTLLPPGKGRWMRGERGRCCQLSRPLAGRAITLLLLNFTTWAVVLTMRLVFGCPINLAFGGFPRWGGRSYRGSVERGGVCSLQWEGTAARRACGLGGDPEEGSGAGPPESHGERGARAGGKALVLRKRRFLLLTPSFSTAPGSWLWPARAICHPQEKPPRVFWEVGVLTDPEQGLGGLTADLPLNGTPPPAPTLHTSLIWAFLWPVGLTQST